MKEHIRTYIEGMGYDPDLSFEDQFIPCEICEHKAVDVHHIDARGMGGNSRSYELSELMGLCRICHEEVGDKILLKPLLRRIHRLVLKSRIALKALQV